jgi:hypothetical protein
MKKFLSAVICLSTILAWQPAQSGSFINWQPLLKDVVATNPGFESIAPFFIFKDRDQDGDEDELYINFHVWSTSAATPTKLFKTQQRGVLLPAPPCSSPIANSVNSDFDVKFTNETGGRSNVVVLFIIECTESGTFDLKEAIKTIVYSADVTKAPSGGGTSWLKAWNEDTLAFNNLDWDTDGSKEIILTLVVEDPATGNEDTRLIILQQSDGTVEYSARYPIVIVN